jgi:hypothetical protein
MCVRFALAHVRTLPRFAELGRRLLCIHQLAQFGVAHGALLSLEDGIGALLAGAHTLVPARHARHRRWCIETDGALGRSRRSCNWRRGGCGGSGSLVDLDVSSEILLLSCCEVTDRARKRLLPRVGSDVLVEVALGVGSVGADSARMRLLPRVGSGVHDQVALGVGSVSADGARKRPLPRVGSGVHVQVAFSGCSVGADGARKRLFPRVGSGVHGHVALGVGSEDTDGARIRLLPRVGSDVLVQVALGGGSVGADGTGKRLLPRVGSDVLVQVALGGGSVGADGARKRLLPRVGSDVLVQVALLCSLIFTVGTRVHHHLPTKLRTQDSQTPTELPQVSESRVRSPVPSLPNSFTYLQCTLRAVRRLDVVTEPCHRDISGVGAGGYSCTYFFTGGPLLPLSGKRLLIFYTFTERKEVGGPPTHYP